LRVGGGLTTPRLRFVRPLLAGQSFVRPFLARKSFVRPLLSGQSFVRPLLFGQGLSRSKRGSFRFTLSTTSGGDQRKTARLLGNHPGGNPGANLKSISHRCHPILVAFVWELTKETIYLPLGCIQGGKSTIRPGPRSTSTFHRAWASAGSLVTLLVALLAAW